MMPATARTMAPPTPTHTPIMVFLVPEDMPELLLLLLDWLRLAVGVMTEALDMVDVEPSELVVV